MRKLWLKVKQSTGWRVVRRAYARWAEADGNERASAFAYYLLLSFLPLVILLVTAGSLFVQRDVATQAVMQWLKHYMPLTSEQEHSAVTTIGGVLAARGQISLAAVPLLLWSALQFLGVLIRATNRLWHSPTYNLVAVAVKKPGLARHHGERWVDWHFAARGGANVPGVAHHPPWISKLDVRRDFPAYSVAGFLLRADHDLSAGPEPGHPVFRSLARCAGRNGLDLDW